MLRIVEEMDTPVGYKAALIRGKIVVSPWSKLRYKRAMKALRLQLSPTPRKGTTSMWRPFSSGSLVLSAALGRTSTSRHVAAFDVKAATPMQPPSPSPPS